MATKVTSGKLNVSVTESVTVNGVEQTYTSVTSIAGIQRTHHRIIRVPLADGAAPGNWTIFASTGASAAGGAFVPADIKYIRITNLDDTNFVIIRFQEDGQDQYNIRLSAGETWTGYSAGFEAERVAGNIGNYAALRATADSISAVAGGDAVDVEVFIASKTDT